MMPSDTKSASRALFRTRRLVIPALVIAVGTFVACEGDNLFKPDNEATRPRVTAIDGPSVVESGMPLTLTVRGDAPHGAAELALSLSGVVVFDTVVELASSPKNVAQAVSIPMPGPFADSVLTVTAAIRDAIGNVSRAVTDSFPAFGSAVPEITILAPGNLATFPIGDSILVRARIADRTGIARVSMRGVAVRQDSASDTRIVTRFNERTIEFPQPPAVALPRDTTIVRFLIPVPDTASESVQIIVEAEDSLGFVAESVVNIGVGGPRVEIRSPANGSRVQAGGTLVVQAFAVDRGSGIDSMKVMLSGVQDSIFVWKNLASPDSVRRDTSFVVGPNPGILAISARAWSRAGHEGSTAAPVEIEVVNTQVADTEAPRVGLTVTTPERVELDDSIQVRLVAEDQGTAGLRRVGVLMIALPDTTALAPDTLVIDEVFASPRTGQVDRTFHVRLADFPFSDTGTVRMPRRFTLQIHAFAVDTAGNVGANTAAALAAGPATRVNVGATVIRPDTAGYVAEGSSGLQRVVTGVVGNSVTLPSGGAIAHSVVDAGRQMLYLSNLSRNRVEVLNLATNSFMSPIQVGSEPWGMFMSADNDTLIVANSGGTNISFVDLTTMREHTARRLLTPNAALFEVKSSVSNGLIRYEGLFYDFSDRPQFIAQDAHGRLLYSTKPTGTAQQGTIRFVELAGGGGPESYILYNMQAVQQAENTYAIANIDSLVIIPAAETDYQVELFDHVPGNSALILRSGPNTLEAAVDVLRTLGSDIAVHAGAWVPENVGLSDTTYIATAGDRSYIAFGEGGVGIGARIMLWSANDAAISNQITVADIVSNASEQVLGLGLDSNGRIGVARGTESTYFFSNGIDGAGDLRLQGVFSDGVAGGQGGAALHPNHVYSAGSSPETLSFIATANRTIKIVDTFHFFERGEVAIRDQIVGQLRTSLPFPGDNAGLAPGDPDYILIKLYGVTDTGAVVIVPIRNKDLVD